MKRNEEVASKLEKVNFSVHRDLASDDLEFVILSADGEDIDSMPLKKTIRIKDI